MNKEWKSWKFAGIYGIRHISDGKVYVGQSHNIAQRIRFHKDSNREYGNLYREIGIFGWENFDVVVLERVDDPSLLNESEKRWIDKLESCNPEKGYNIQQIPNVKIGDMKQKTSFALSDEARRLLLWLAAYFGVSQAGVIEMLLRDKMRQVADKEQSKSNKE